MILLLTKLKDREAEPRFTGPPAGGARGGYEGGPGRGGFGGGFGGGMGAGGGAGGGGRQIYVSNVCNILPALIYYFFRTGLILTANFSFPTL